MSGTVHLDVVDAVEVAGALEFVADWLSFDRPCLEASLCRFATGHYRIDDLHADLVRLAGIISTAPAVALDHQGRRS